MLNRMRRRTEPDDASSKDAGTRRRSWNDGLFYELQLNGPAPDRLNLNVDDPYKPDTEEADAFLALYQQEEQHISSLDTHKDGFLSPWKTAAPGSLQYHRLQTFLWLPGLAARGDNARQVARAMVDGWLTLHGRFSPDAWGPRLVSDRLWQLARHGSWLLQGSDALWRSRVLTSMARQTRHLGKAVSRVEDPVERLFCAMTLSLMGLGLPHHRVCEEQGSTLLRRELRLQLRADGGHISRNPSLQLKIAASLQSLLTTYRTLNVPPPNYLHHAVGRTTDMVEFFRCGDGRIAVFNDGTEDDPKALAAVLAFDSIGRNRIDFASQSGYQRLSGARSFLYVDTGTSALSQREARERQRSSCVYDGAFAIQFSSGRQRIITNCGAAKALVTSNAGLDVHAYQEWRQALARPDAHSTLCIENELSGQQTGSAEERVYHHLEEDRQGQLLELERMGLTGAPGCTHRRRLFLSVDGDDLRGEDILIPPAGERSPAWCLRFHLYPTIRVSLSRDGRSVILATPQNEGWRFIAGDALISLERSIYCGAPGPVQKTEQIVVRPRKSDANIKQVKWAFKK